MRFQFAEVVALKGGDKANPQKIGEALEAITAAAGGVLTPLAVVEAARHPRHALHRFFEWNDAKAAEAHRLDQARGIIRCVRIEDDEAEDGTIRAFVSVSQKGGTSYHRAGDVKNSAELQAAVLKQAEVDLNAFLHRYRDLKAICSIIERAKVEAAAMRRRTEKRSGGGARSRTKVKATKPKEVRRAH